MRVKVNFALLKMMLFVEHSYEVSFNNIASKSVDFNNIFSKSWRQRLDKSPSVNSGKMYVVLRKFTPCFQEVYSVVCHNKLILTDHD